MMGVSAASPSSCCPRLYHFTPLSISTSSLKNMSSCRGLLPLCRRALCQAAKQQQQRAPAKKKAGRRKGPERPPADDGGGPVEVVPARQNNRSPPPSPLPKPPAGFVLDEFGRVLLASSKRTVTIIDATNNLPLECVIRRIFESSAGEECMLLYPVDPPIHILKSTNFEEWLPVDDEEAEAILPNVAYALAKINMHLVVSGFCYTARGGSFYSDEDILEFDNDDEDDSEDSPMEGLRLTCFTLDGTNYMIYTPSDPHLFVAIKDKNGLWQMADDDLYDDPAVISAADEETQFNALVEEEAALLASALGEE